MRLLVKRSSDEVAERFGLLFTRVTISKGTGYVRLR